MPEPTTYEIVIRGRAGERLLRPLVDDFAIDRSIAGHTRLIGIVRDPAHLHGVLAHLTSATAEVVSVVPHHTTRSDREETTMSAILSRSPDEVSTSSRPGGVAALVAAATFVFGIALFATALSDYTSGDPTSAESVEFVVAHQTTLFLWYLVIFIVFGAALVPLVRALQRRLHAGAPALADTGAVFGYIWAGLMFATGMVSNIGIQVVADLAERDPDQAAAVWASIDAVTDGLGGGNEIVGGLWVLLVSLGALRTGALPRALNLLGVVSATAGLVTLVPGLTDVGIVFGLGLIVWFAWLGVVLVRDRGVVRSAEWTTVAAAE